MRRLPSALALLLFIPGCAAESVMPEAAPAQEPAVTTEATQTAKAPLAEATRVEIPDLEARLAGLTAELEEQRESSHIAGMALAIVKDDELIYARGFGVADIETQRPATPQTLFAIGSSTKAFTSALIGMQIDEGRMNWDDPITGFLPYFDLQIDADGNPDVTLRDLLCHRTGFTRMGVLWAAGQTTPETILRTATQAEAWSPFREKFFYNNVMFLAAGEACAVAAESDWDELVQTRIFDPLHMDDSNTSVSIAQLDPRLSKGYQWDSENEVNDLKRMRVLDSIAPAGAINSNVLDMAQWIRFQLGRGTFEGQSLVQADRIQETWTAQIEIQSGIEYGMGWMLSEWQGQPVVEHGGNIDGFSAEVALLPESNLGFVLLINASAAPLQQTSRSIVWDALLGERELSSGPVEATADLSQADELSDFLGTYIANYATFVDAKFVVSIQNGKLALDVPGQMNFELQDPDEEGKRAFAIAPDQIQASFERDDDGEVVLIKLYQGGKTFEVPREGVIFPPDMSDEEFAPFLGSYRHPKLEDLITVVIRGGRLAVDVPGQMVFELRLPEEDVWHFRVTEELGLQFHEDDAGKVVSLTFHESGTESLCPRVGLEGIVELPTTDAILELRRATAIGQRIDELGSMRMTGTMRFVHSGIEGETTSTFAGDRFLANSSFQPFGWTRTGYDGEVGWATSAFAEADTLEGVLLDQLRLSHPAVFFGDWSRHFDSIQVARVSEIDGRRHWAVRLKKGEYPAMVAYVDAQTGDVTKLDTKLVIPGAGTLSQTVKLEDYRETNGIRLPFRIVTENPSNGRVVVEWKTIEGGIDLPEGCFEQH